MTDITGEVITLLLSLYRLAKLTKEERIKEKKVKRREKELAEKALQIGRAHV